MRTPGRHHRRAAPVYPRGLAGEVAWRLLPWGDLIMMRRQLLKLRALAEATPVGA